MFGFQLATKQNIVQVDIGWFVLRPDAPTFFPSVVEKDEPPILVDTASSQIAIMEALPDGNAYEYFEVLESEGLAFKNKGFPLKDQGDAQFKLAAADENNITNLLGAMASLDSVSHWIRSFSWTRRSLLMWARRALGHHV